MTYTDLDRRLQRLERHFEINAVESSIETLTGAMAAHTTDPVVLARVYSAIEAPFKASLISAAAQWRIYRDNETQLWKDDDSLAPLWSAAWPLSLDSNPEPRRGRMYQLMFGGPPPQVAKFDAKRPFLWVLDVREWLVHRMVSRHGVSALRDEARSRTLPAFSYDMFPRIPNDQIGDLLRLVEPLADHEDDLPMLCWVDDDGYFSVSDLRHSTEQRGVDIDGQQWTQRRAVAEVDVPE